MLSETFESHLYQVASESILGPPRYGYVPFKISPLFPLWRLKPRFPSTAEQPLHNSCPRHFSHLPPVPSCPLQSGLLPFLPTELLLFPQKPCFSHFYKSLCSSLCPKFISPSCLSSCSSFKIQLKHHLLLELFLSLHTLLHSHKFYSPYSRGVVYTPYYNTYPVEWYFMLPSR